MSNQPETATMKLIKAYVRPGRVKEIVRALEQAGAPGISVSRVHGLGFGYDPMMFTIASSEVSAAPQMVKLEVVCHEEEVPPLVDAVLAAGQTGTPGDGIIFIIPVERTVRIRTGEERLGRLHGRPAAKP